MIISQELFSKRVEEIYHHSSGLLKISECVLEVLKSYEIEEQDSKQYITKKLRRLLLYEAIRYKNVTEDIEEKGSLDEFF